MGTFVTQEETPTLFEDKEPAPGQTRRPGFEDKHVPMAEDLNDLKYAALDLREAVRANIEDISAAEAAHAALLADGSALPILATGSTTTRTAAQRAADVFNIKDFGAVGDGVADDAAEAQAAVDAAVAAGRSEVRVPLAALNLGSALDAKGCRLLCDGTEITGIINGHAGIVGGKLKGYRQDEATLYPRPERAKTRPLVVQQTSATVAWVFAWKDSLTAQAYVLMEMVYNNTTLTESEGVNSQLWRLGKVWDVAVGYVLYRGAPTLSGAWTSSNKSLGTNGNQSMPYHRTTTQNDYVEWTGISGPTISLGFLTSSTGAIAEVLIDGVSQGTFDTTGTTGNLVFRREYPTTPGTHTVRVKHADARATRNLWVFGPNFFEMKDALPGLAYDNLYYGREDVAFPNYIINQGANEYAIYNSDAGKWAGSYHGGETATTPAVWRLDGAATTLATGDIKVARSVRVEQQTAIAWASRPADTLTTRSRTDFHDGGLSFSCEMHGAGVLVRDFFTHMTKASDTFTRVIFPQDVDTTDTADARYDGSQFNLGRVNKLVQMEPATGRTITSWFSLHPYEVTTRGGLTIKPAAGSYHKAYYALAEGARRTVTQAAFESTWVFA